jgi:hypothetical protein
LVSRNNDSVETDTVAKGLILWLLGVPGLIVLGLLFFGVL